MDKTQKMTQLVEEDSPATQNENKNENRSEESFKIPVNLKKTFYFSLFLFSIGLTLIILGFIHQVRNLDPGKGLTFWILGSIVLIPGGFYTYQFCKASRAKDLDQRKDILNEIPDIN
jgi:hypothetical protein